MRKALHIALILLLSCGALNAQSTDEQLAAHYFQNGEFEKAALYYERLYKEDPKHYFYQQLFNSYLQLEQTKEAEKLAKGQQKKFPANLTYFVDLGGLYKSLDEEAKAEQQFSKAVKGVGANQSQIRQLANAFIAKSEYQFALETYKKGQKLLRDNYAFNYELANLHGMRGDHEAMIAEYLDLLAVNEAYTQTVQNSLNRLLDFSEDGPRLEMLRTSLLKRIQRNPEKIIFSEMLIWMYLQKKDFYAAMVQSKALDKRWKENGNRLMSLAGTCTTNERYDVALDCYQYVLDQGSEGPYYLKARIGSINVLDKKVTSGNSYSAEDLEELKTRYQTALTDLGKGPATVQLMRGLAHLHAFYLGEHAEATALLNEVVAMPGIPVKATAEAKLELGDINVMTGDIWDASLLFSQVDKDFKHDLLGHEAKFRNARISFYVGDFSWAQAQLDVLKASTSKLISNDAMDLSLLITDNLALDTVSEPLEMFARADLLTYQNRFDEATSTLDSIYTTFPMHSLSDEILFQRYKIAYGLGQFEESATFLEKVIELYAMDILADNAIFSLAELYQIELNDQEKAKELYQKLIFDHPGSLYVAEARKRFRALRGDTEEINDQEIRSIEQ